MKIISVDFQREFTRREGKCYVPGEALKFLSEVLIPFVRERGIKIAEIISDYRQPRPGDSRDCLYPGTDMYLSEIPNDVKEGFVWIKCMNSPVWVRENIGVAGGTPGPPYPDPGAFEGWLREVLGEEREVLLIGLTADRCVLATAQELTYRGYKVYVLEEGVDTSSGKEEKRRVLHNVPFTHWAEAVSWEWAERQLCEKSD